jgi:hypothetical protein
VIGIALPVLNVVVVGEAISRLRAAGVDGAGALYAVIALYVLLGALLVASAVGLYGLKSWGRVLAFVFAGGAFAGVVLSVIIGMVIEGLPSDHPIAPIQFNAGAPALSPLYGIALLVDLNLPSVKPLFGAGAAPPAPRGAHPLAIVSLILSMVPFMLLTQLAALVVGIVALKKISASQGQFGGRGFAIAGVSIAGSILGLIATILIAVLALSK